MFYSESEIYELGCHQLSKTEIDRALVALNGFAELFGMRWVDEHIGYGGSLLVLDIISYWDDWSTIKHLEGADKILKRWKEGTYTQGIQTEIHVTAHFARCGALIELEPSTPERKADCRFRLNASEDWIYVETTKRSLSESSKRAEEIRRLVAEAAARAAKGRLGVAVILREPDDGELHKLLAWFNSISSSEESKIDNIAVFFTQPRTDGFPGDLDRIEKLIPRPLYFSSFVRGSDELGIVYFHIPDENVPFILETEAQQLSPDHPGIIVINMIQVAAGLKYWPAMIKNTFQTAAGQKISAVVLFGIYHAGEGLRKEGLVLVNPIAKKPISDATITILGKLANKYDQP